MLQAQFQAAEIIFNEPYYATLFPLTSAWNQIIFKTYFHREIALKILNVNVN